MGWGGGEWALLCCGVAVMIASEWRSSNDS